MKTRLPVSVALATLLAGCPQVPPTATPPGSPGGSATPRPSTSTVPSAQPTGAATPTAGPSAVPTASATPAASATPTAAASTTPSPALASGGLLRFAEFYDLDAIGNWVPGQTVEGALHVNRGNPNPTGVGIGANDPGRSLFHVVIEDLPGNPGFKAKPGLAKYPIFKGPVSVGFKAGADLAPSADGLVGTSHWLGGNMPAAGFDATQVFPHPANAKALDGRPGPVLAADVPLPAPLAGKLGAALGLPAGTEPADRSWFAALPDGVFVPTAGMATGPAVAYEPGAAAAGGIYVRGTVEVMRAAVVGTTSYLMFQVGYPGGLERRTYVVAADRAGRTLRLTALPAGVLLRAALEAAGGDPAVLALRDAMETRALAAWGLTGDTAATMTFTAPPGAAAPFNGVVAVDLGADDPLRDPARPGRLLPEAATRFAQTGHILALGDPAVPAAKRGLRGTAAALAGSLALGEAFSTEAADGTATGLTIAAAGSIYVQNHLLVTGLLGADTTAAALDARLLPGGVPPTASRDRLALRADHHVFLGLAAPGGGVGEVGLVVTASLLGLGDPGRDPWAKALTLPNPLWSIPGTYYGAVATEGITFPYGSAEPVAIGTGTGGRVAPAASWDRYTVANPIYAATGGEILIDGTSGPNDQPRGRALIFGSVVSAKRGLYGLGNRSYERDFRFDARLATLPPPLID